MFNVSEVRAFGCGTCDQKHINHSQVIRDLRTNRCFFMQNAKPFARILPTLKRLPAIAHISEFSSDEVKALLLRTPHRGIRSSSTFGRRP